MLQNYQKFVDSELDFIKKHTIPYTLIVRNANSDIIGYLEAITTRDEKDNAVIKDLKVWREKNQQAFPSQFKVTLKGTRSWFKAQLIGKNDRILFFVKDLDGNRVGHVGLYRFDYKKHTCEIDNVIRGSKSSPGIMTMALTTLINWTKNELKTDNIFLTVFSDNPKAIKLYRRCGFIDHKLIPLEKKVSGKVINWEENYKIDPKKAERSYLKMILS
ncbi:MAG: GNAT family N-acetyltransferase [Candidatus Levybacteria bacterium]|nr:GNAT family N-acetyltransferase [Candidatus Levybacteria bacterium]